MFFCFFVWIFSLPLQKVILVTKKGLLIVIHSSEDGFLSDITL